MAMLCRARWSECGDTDAIDAEGDGIADAALRESWRLLIML